MQNQGKGLSLQNQEKNLRPKELVLYKKEQNEHQRYDLEGTTLIMSRFVEHKDDKLYTI